MLARGDDPRRLEGLVVDQRYRLERWLGSGGMGAVYRAEQLSLQRPVALKLLQSRCRLDYAHQRRFIREARVASTIVHPNVTRVFDFGQSAEGHTYLAMEYLPGQDLSRRLHRGGALDWPRTRSILLQTVAGLRAAHDLGVIHRDVKPSNVFLVKGRDGQPGAVKVLDFGLAKALDPESSLAEALTMADEVMGTAQYMAPERVRGEEADVSSDIYSLGVMTYRMLSGVLPLWGTRGPVFRRLMRRLKEPPPRLQRLVPSLPEAVSALVLRAMARHPDDRFPSLIALAEAIEAIEAGKPHPTPRATWASPTSRPHRLGSGALRSTRPIRIPSGSSSSPSAPSSSGLVRPSRSGPSPS